MDRYYKKWFFPLALPSMILFVVVILVPFLLGALYSFTSWRGTYFSGGGLWESFVGLQNYQAAFQNQKFLDAFWYTIKFTVIAVITINVTALALALMVTKISRLSGIFRTIFFLPNMLGGLALGFIWQFIFQIVFSQILFGPESLLPIPFLQNMTQDNTKALFALAILVTWQMAGYMMIIYITGLNNIPYDLYEAAEIDGANSWQKLRSITLPLVAPAFTVGLFLSLSNCFKLYDQNLALTNGGPFDSTEMIALNIYNTAFRYNDLGLAQAKAVIFLVIVAAIGLTQLYFSKRKEVEM